MTPPDDDALLLTVAQAAARLGLTPDCVYRLCRSNRIGHFRLGQKGGAIKLRPADVRRYLRSCLVEPATPRGQGPGRKLRHITV